MIYRVLTEFNQNPSKNQDFKELKLLTVKLLIIIKDQLFKVNRANLLKTGLRKA
jgi:hypothetical protein